MVQISKQDLEEFKRITREMRDLEFPNDEAAMRAAQRLVRLFEKRRTLKLPTLKS